MRQGDWSKSNNNNLGKDAAYTNNANPADPSDFSGDVSFLGPTDLLNWGGSRLFLRTIYSIRL